ncbi:hypothetical protein [Actinoallomurus rhizosphaericola]|uniref:hypothetical protein n=1 Tax=Actinoallomurus rhizosphaericola TaxID=2952536 RepID=UPI002090EEF2|nr:hypothetical protein [Actinoallomurus rhizosphaericola]MCO5992675.1 hypothetical protein [Actinoallomurus rhizosphaericola]
MPKSSGRRSFGRGSGTVTVIEQQVHRSAIRTAKIAFWVVGVSVALLTATVAASYTHPIVAGLIGVVAGLCVGFPVAGFIVAWPVLRVLWWWTPEITLATGLVAGWVELASHTNTIVRLMATAVIVGVPAGLKPIRSRVMAVAYCFVTRHRLRVCFNEFIISNRTGSLPLILWARPTPVGERVWIWLRPGLSVEDLQERIERIAPACWADAVTVERASESNAALVRLDVKRRQVLGGTVVSPLVDLVDSDAPATERDTVPAPTDLDLTDVTAASVTTTPLKRETKPTKKPADEPAAAAAAVGGEDVSDWI